MGAVQPGKQVSNQPQKERDILKDKLGQIHVSEGSHQHHILRGGGEGRGGEGRGGWRGGGWGGGEEGK